MGLLGCGSVHASLIKGGRELSSYPDRCELDIERRILPGETREVVEAELDAVLQRLGEDPRSQAKHEVGFFRSPFEIPESERLPQTLKSSVEDVRGSSASFFGMTGWTDSALLGEAGIPAVVFGPGGAGLHGLEEYGSTEQICHCRDILVDFARNR